MAKKDPKQLDLHDLSYFYDIFKKLYDVPSTHPNDSENTRSVANCLKNEHLIPESQNDLNSPKTIEELNNAIRTRAKAKLQVKIAPDLTNSCSTLTPSLD